jgi:hypothetical protein
MKFREDGYRRFSRGSYLIGYVKPFIAEYVAIVKYLSEGVPSILRDIVSPSMRNPLEFDSRPFSDAVASNVLQTKSVRGLQFTVEGIQGPPGTGKSSTIFHIVNSAMPLGMDAIVTCVQNRAVDALACKFQSSAVRFLVIGSPDRLGDTAKQHSLSCLVARDPTVVSFQQVVSWLKRVLEFLHTCRAKREARCPFKSSGWKRWWAGYVREATAKDISEWSHKVGESMSALVETVDTVKEVISSSTTVFLCTVDALCRVGVKKINTRRLLIIDEAGTVPEYKLPLAVSLGIVAVIAVGDQNQLQPFTHTDVSNGFFHRLAKEVSPLAMLEEQFRMHPAICSFVSSSFYGNRLVTNPLIAEARRAVPQAGIFWLDYPDTHAENTGRNGAIFNNVELGVLRAFMLSVEKDILIHGRSVMIIAFYREQYNLLMAMGERIGLVGTRMVDNKTEKFFVHPLFRISTVDASQGSEADVVVLSCVRCNATKSIGFLKQPNRMCVALSRARERLVVVGSSKTIASGNAVWGALFKASHVLDSFEQEEISLPFATWDHCWDALP